tara:strand:- start:382 stop:585 length:204 start_codon:yes stop_codon:yes gene_type:complete
MKQHILKALEKRYEAEVCEAEATIKIYFNNSVGIGEHPQHIDEVDKLLEKIVNAEEKLKIVKELDNG